MGQHFNDFEIGLLRCDIDQNGSSVFETGSAVESVAKQICAAACQYDFTDRFAKFGMNVWSEGGKPQHCPVNLSGAYLPSAFIQRQKFCAIKTVD